MNLRVLHVITGLNRGGAENMLARLVSTHVTNGTVCRVVSLVPGGDVAADIRVSNTPVDVLGLRPYWPIAIARVRRIVREFQPDVIQGWMPHGNLVATLARYWASKRHALLWNLRLSNLDASVNTNSTMVAMRAGAALSHLPDAIICCSDAARSAHVSRGYDSSAMVVLPNGFDLTRFQPDPDCRNAVRSEFNLPENATIVLRVARLDPHKDHGTFLRAVAKVPFRPNLKFVLCGRGMTWSSTQVSNIIRSLAIGDRVLLLGERTDIPRLLAGADLLVSSSVGEGFPNVIGEAMATGIPCVATDVGDSANIIGDTGYIVPRLDPDALAEAISRFVESGCAARQLLGQAARNRIMNHFELNAVAGRYLDLYRSLTPCAA